MVRTTVRIMKQKKPASVDTGLSAYVMVSTTAVHLSSPVPLLHGMTCFRLKMLERNSLLTGLWFKNKQWLPRVTEKSYLNSLPLIMKFKIIQQILGHLKNLKDFQIFSSLKDYKCPNMLPLWVFNIHAHSSPKNIILKLKSPS